MDKFNKLLIQIERNPSEILRYKKLYQEKETQLTGAMKYLTDFDSLKKNLDTIEPFIKDSLKNVLLGSVKGNFGVQIKDINSKINKLSEKLNEANSKRYEEQKDDELL